MKRWLRAQTELCCVLVLLWGCCAGQAQVLPRRDRLLGSYHTGQMLPVTAGDDKSRLVNVAITASGILAKLEKNARLLAELMPLAQDTLTPPSGPEDFLRRLGRLDALLSQLRTPLQDLGEVLSRFEQQRVPVPYRLALYPTVQLRVDRETLWFVAGATWSDDSIALDVSGLYIRAGSADEGGVVLVRHDVTPQKQRASRALQELGQETRRLSGVDARTLTRLITSVKDLSLAVGRMEQLLEPLRMQVLELVPLVERLDEQPQEFQRLSNLYVTMVSPFREALLDSVELLGSGSEEFNRFFGQYGSGVRDTQREMVRSALVPHLALEAGVGSFRHSGKAQVAGFALSQQIPFKSASGLLCALSGQYMWATSGSRASVVGSRWSIVAAWMDKLSSYDPNGKPVLRRWQWQVGVEHQFCTGVAERSFGVFVRWRPANQLWDYALFWSHDEGSGGEVGLAIRTVLGVEPY